MIAAVHNSQSTTVTIKANAPDRGAIGFGQSATVHIFALVRVQPCIYLL